MTRFFGALAFSVVFASCGTQHPQRSMLGFASPASAAPAHEARRVPRAAAIVLVTLDGARWQDVFDAKLMPNLHRWMTLEGAAIGAPNHGEIWSSGPNYVSMPGYTEILTGRTSACQTNECAQTTASTLVDEIEDSVVVSSWERIALVATRDPLHTAMSTGRIGGGRRDAFDAAALERGEKSHAWPGIDDYRPDALTMPIALRLFESRTPTFTFVGLGDSDEHAHHGERERYRESLRAADRFLAELEARIAPSTVVFVTADHGRAENFRDHGGGNVESGRVWLVAHGDAITARGMLDTANHRLADIAPTVRCLLDLPRDHARTAGMPIRELCEE